MKIDLEKIPDEIPAIWVLALAMIQMNPDSEDHVPTLKAAISGMPLDSSVAYLLAVSLLHAEYIILKPSRDYSKRAFTLTAKGHRLLDFVEA